MPKFRKKPVVIEAMQSGDDDAAIIAWAGPHNIQRGAFDGLDISTLEGVLHASDGDWIIRGVKGEFYPCKPDIFAAKYELVKDVAG